MISFWITGMWSYRFPSKQVSSYTKPGPFAYSGMELLEGVYLFKNEKNVTLCLSLLCIVVVYFHAVVTNKKIYFLGVH